MCNFGSRIKVCIREFREFIIVMPNFDTNKEINSSIAAKLLKVEIKKSEKDKR